MESIRVAPPMLLLATLLLLGGCENSDERLRREVTQRISADLAKREDVPPADAQAAAEAFAEDVVQLRREIEATREEREAARQKLEQELPSQAELEARDCEQRRLELDALRRLEADPDSIDEAQRQALPAEIRNAAAALAERCPGT